VYRRMPQPRSPLPAIAAIVKVLALCFCTTSYAIETIPLTDDYLLRTWEVEAGLPHNTVFGITQTPDGYLWLATPRGLTRFDGIRFTVYSKQETTGLESNYVRAVFASREGDLWVGLERGGVSRRHGGIFEIIAPMAPRTAMTSWTSSFAQDAAGAIWFGRAPDPIAFKWDAGTLVKFTDKDGIGSGRDTFVSGEEDGRIWYSTKSGCGVMDRDRFRPIDPSGGGLVRLTSASGGGMWAARGDYLLRYKADGYPRVVSDLSWLSRLLKNPTPDLDGEFGGTEAASPGIPASEVTVLYEDGNGVLWLGTRNSGLFRFRDGKFERVPTSSNGILSLMEDREGNLWAGTSDGGLNRLSPNRFSLRRSKHGLGRDTVISMCADTEGSLWLAIQDGMLVRSLDANHETFAPPAGWPGGPISVVCRDPKGGIWIGFDSAELLHWQEGTFSKVKLPRDNVRSLLADRQGTLWIATARGGLYNYADGAVHETPTAGGLVVARALAEDSSGHLWVGTEEGLVFQRQADGHFASISLPGAKPGESIRFLTPDANGSVWIGAVEGGLYRWKAGQVTHLSQSAGLPNDDLRSLAITENGELWITSGRGLFRVPREDIEAAMADPSRPLTLDAYGPNEGVQSMEFMFGSRNATAQTQNGHLWFATSRGALEIGPEIRSGKAQLASPLIEEMRAAGQMTPLDGKELTFPPGIRDVEISYTLPETAAPERLRFRYRLEGYDDSWVTAGTQRVARFPKLPAGDYQFQVQAFAPNGMLLPREASLKFTVRTAWWETAWFRILAIASGVIVLAAIVRVVMLRQIRARLHRLEEQTALDRERARIARDMHDELGASLTRITLMSDLAALEVKSNSEARDQFNNIASAARKIAGTLDEIVWTVNPRNDTLEQLAGYVGEFASEYLNAAGIAMNLELPSEIPPLTVSSEIRHQLLLAVKEALNNIVKYSAATEVVVRMIYAEQSLEFVVSDDGRGFEPSAISETANGLRNMRQRLAGLGGSALIESRLGIGTTISFSLPLAQTKSNPANLT